MKLTEFRISMYKGILDTDWVDVKDLTVLVGKNESGKTSLLKALHKLNPDNSEPYDIKKEWPRGRLPEQNPKHIVCQARFQLIDEEKSDLSQIINAEKIPDTVEASRNYAGELKIIFGEEFPLDDSPSFQIDSDSLQDTLDQLPEVKDNFSTKFKNAAFQCIDEIMSLTDQKRFTEFSQLTQKHKSLLPKARASSNSNSFSAEGQFINTYWASLDQFNKLFQELPSIQSEVNKYLDKHLPKFIYMDDYRIFTGAAQLDEIKARKDSDSLTDADKTFITILSLSGLDIDQLVELNTDSTEAIEERQNALVGGGESLTKIILDRLSQREYAIDYRVDGQYFFSNVKDNHDPTPIQLEERSRGFQWFFSFDLMLMHATPEEFKGCVILLDEPGLHLHPGAQKDLLDCLEEYATANTLIYTTHLPFMIDLKHPDRIRILKEKDNKIVVETHLTESDPGSRLVLQSALEINASQNYLVAPRNLVVEGIHDYWILTELSNLLKRSGEKGLPEDVFITPGASASEAVPIVIFMIGQKLDVIALFDSDKAGRDARDQLVKKWYTHFNKEIHSEVIMLGDAIGVKDDFELEDIFPEDFYVEFVEKTYKKKLEFRDISKINLQGQGMLWNKVKAFFAKHKIFEKHEKEKLSKGSVAKNLRERMIQMKDASELPEDTQKKARKLFKAIRKALGEKETDSSDTVKKNHIGTEISPISINTEGAEPIPANFVRATPPGGEIAANGSITVTFDNAPADVKVSDGTVTIAGKTAMIVGPFTPGPLTLIMTWFDSAKVLNYTVTASDTDPPAVTGGTVKDGDKDVDPEAINTAGSIEIEFSEDVSGNVALQTEGGDDVGWLGKVEGNKATLEIVKGKEIGNETTYVIAGKVSDAAGNSANISLTFVTKPIIMARSIIWKAYWDKFKTYVKENGNHLQLFPEPNLPSVYRIQINQKNQDSTNIRKDHAFWLVAYRTRNELQANLCLQSSTQYSRLKKKRHTIERTLGELKWDDNLNRIGFSDNTVGDISTANTNQEFAWLQNRLLRLQTEFQRTILRTQE